MAGLWWDEVEDVDNKSYDALGDAGRVFEQWDAKVFVELLNSVESVPDLEKGRGRRP